MLDPWKERYDKLRILSLDITSLAKVCMVIAMLFLFVFQYSNTDVRVGLWGRLSTKKLMLSNFGAGEDSGESVEQLGNWTSQFW